MTGFCLKSFILDEPPSITPFAPAVIPDAVTDTVLYNPPLRVTIQRNNVKIKHPTKLRYKSTLTANEKAPQT